MRGQLGVGLHRVIGLGLQSNTLRSAQWRKSACLPAAIYLRAL